MARTLPRPIDYPDPLARDMAALGALVRNQRAKSALRIDDAADVLGVSKDVLSRLENGRPVGLDKLFKILNGLGLNLLVVTKRDVHMAKMALLHQTARSTNRSPAEDA